jgi:hypothetical protein
VQGRGAPRSEQRPRGPSLSHTRGCHRCDGGDRSSRRQAPWDGVIRSCVIATLGSECQSSSVVEGVASEAQEASQLLARHAKRTRHTFDDARDETVLTYIVNLLTYIVNVGSNVT